MEMMKIGSCQVLRGWGLDGFGIAFEADETVRNQSGAVVKNAVNVPNATELYTLRWLILLRESHLF